MTFYLWGRVYKYTQHMGESEGMQRSPKPQAADSTSAAHATKESEGQEMPSSDRQDRELWCWWW